MNFERDAEGIIRSACGRYIIRIGFSAAHGCRVYRPWRLADEYQWDVPLGEYFRLPYAEAACRNDAGVEA